MKKFSLMGLKFSDRQHKSVTVGSVIRYNLFTLFQLDLKFQLDFPIISTRKQNFIKCIWVSFFKGKYKKEIIKKIKKRKK